jgi:hypothetical protein
MVINVRRNPAQVCTVNMVPTRDASESSATLAENCAESATTVIPQTIQTTPRITGEPPKRRPMTSAQVPLIAIAPMVNHVRP